MTFHAQSPHGLNGTHAQQQIGQQQFTHHGPTQRRHVSKHQFAVELSQCLFDFVIQLLPTQEEMAVKEDVRKLLERLIRSIEPASRLLSFGSTANGFSLRNSDMDLCCLIDSDERLAASDLVTMLGDLLERETKFQVKPLPHARIPIVKLSLDPSSPGLPHGIACDIGFENRLALENTRLLMCYSMIDPARVRTLVLFLKVWSKRRKINSPYKGTLSSYGYVLLIIYFLVHVKNPPVLPNLQQIPPLRPMPHEEYHISEHNVWFFDDIELLCQRWQSSNTETVASLLIDFFRYYARDFSYNTGVASIRAGLLKKDTKGWQSDIDSSRYHDSRGERNRLCIEDPFETDYNVARCVTKDGLYTIRGEFMRASRILAARPERAIVALAQLCEERQEEELIRASPPTQTFVPPRLSIPPQTPYTVGSNSLRPNGVPEGDRLSPPRRFFEQGAPLHAPQAVPSRSPPDHMAPKRGKWTSPPPPEASPADHTSFEDRLGLGLSLATSSTEARELEKAYLSSSSNSEIATDDEHTTSDIAAEDDVRSIRSLTEDSGPGVSSVHRRDAYSTGPSAPYRVSQRTFEHPSGAIFRAFLSTDIPFEDSTTPTSHVNRGRRPARLFPSAITEPAPVSYPRISSQMFQLSSSAKTDNGRRSASGPSRISNVQVPLSSTSPAHSIPLPPSPTYRARSSFSPSTTVYYETTPPPPQNRVTMSYPTPHSPMSSLPLYQQQYYFVHGQSHQSPSDSPVTPLSNRRASKSSNSSAESPSSIFVSYAPSSHSHNNSSSTIIAPTTSSTASLRSVPPTPPSEQLSSALSPSRVSLAQHPYESPAAAYRRSFGSGSPPSPNSVESTSPPSTSSLGSASPSSSTSPRSAEFASPISQSPLTQSPITTIGPSKSTGYAMFLKPADTTNGAAPISNLDIEKDLVRAIKQVDLRDKR